MIIFIVIIVIYLKYRSSRCNIVCVPFSVFVFMNARIQMYKSLSIRPVRSHFSLLSVSILVSSLGPAPPFWACSSRITLHEYFTNRRNVVATAAKRSIHLQITEAFQKNCDSHEALGQDRNLRRQDCTERWKHTSRLLCDLSITKELITDFRRICPHPVACVIHGECGNCGDILVSRYNVRLQTQVCQKRGVNT